MNNDTNEVIEMLKKSDGIITDSHLVYTSGKHGSVYLNKDALYPHTAFASRIGELFAEKNKDLDIDVVVAPAVGGTILSTWTAYHLSRLLNKEVLGIYTEKDKGTLASASESEHLLRRGYDKLVKGKRVLVIEDLTTTGISVKKVVKTVQDADGEVIAVSVMINRNPEQINSDMMGVPFSALAELKAEAWDEKDCPLCKNNVPVNTEVGHGKQFLEAKKNT